MNIGIESLKTELIDQLKRHGLPFILMGMAIWFFYNQFNDLRKEVDDCNNAILDLYIKDHQKMREVITDNNRILEFLTEK